MEKLMKVAVSVNSPNYDTNKLKVQESVDYITDSPHPEDGVKLPVPNVSLNEMFMKNKGNMMTWNNFIVLLNNLPGSIKTKGNPVDTHLSLLIEYSNQVSAGNLDILPAIVAEVTDVINIVNDICATIKTTATQLAGFNDLLKHNTWGDASSQLSGLINSLYDDIGRIDRMPGGQQLKYRKQRENDLKQISILDPWLYNVFNRCGSYANSAMSPSQSLVDFWNTSSTQFTDWLAKYNFMKLVNEPQNITKVNLDNCQTTWLNKVYQPFK